MTSTSLTHVGITFPKNDWLTLANEVEASCSARAKKEWLEWGQYFRRTVHSATAVVREGRTAVTIALPEAHWNTVIEILNDAQRGKNQHWISWSNSIIQSIRSVLETVQSSLASQTKAASTVSTQSGLYDTYYQKAKDEWQKLTALEPGKEREEWTRIVSYLQIAINNAQGPIPYALGRMALAMLYLGESHKAEHFSNLAIQQQKHNMFAWITRYALAEQKLLGHNPTIMNDYTSGTGAIFSLFSLGAAAAGKSSKTGALRGVAQSLAWAFVETVRQDEDNSVDEWLVWGEALIGIAESLKQYGIVEGSIYKSVATAPWDKAALGQNRDKVEDLKARAAALYQLAGGR